jgi:hypothetical protein
MVGEGLYLIYPEMPEGVSHGCVAFHQAAKIVAQYWIKLHRALRTGGGLPSSTISLCYHHYGLTEPVFQARWCLVTRNSRWSAQFVRLPYHLVSPVVCTYIHPHTSLRMSFF